MRLCLKALNLTYSGAELYELEKLISKLMKNHLTQAQHGFSCYIYVTFEQR